MIKKLAPRLQGTILGWLLSVVAADHVCFVCTEISWCRLKSPWQGIVVFAEIDTHQTEALSMHSLFLAQIAELLNTRVVKWQHYCLWQT